MLVFLFERVRADVVALVGLVVLGLTGLAALLPIDRLVRPDKEAGVLDQLAVRGFADEVIAAVKIGAHAIGFGLPLLIALLPASALLAQDSPRVETLAAGIAIAVPAPA